LITDDVAAAYMGRTPKTLTRDIRELLRLRLIRRVGAGFAANLDQIEAFVPLARPRRSNRQPFSGDGGGGR
jgi:hypothetical protein